MAASHKTERLTEYVKSNADRIVQSWSALPWEQTTARFAHLWRLLGKERDESLVKAARAAIAPAIAAHFKDGRDVRLYRGFVQSCFEASFPGISLDAEWAAAKERQNSADLEKLQVSLGQAQGALAKDGIRQALTNIAEHYFACGDVHNAIKHVSRVRETCSTPEHHAAYCFQAFRFCAFQESGPSLPSAGAFIQRVEGLGDSIDNLMYARGKIASGLIALDRRSYRPAVNFFTNLRPAGQKATTTLDFAAILEPFMRVTDFALIVAVLALSQLERHALERLLGNPDFKVLFESEAELRTAMGNFFECKYFDAISTLNKLSPSMRLDIFLAPHAGSLVQAVRAKAVRQYVQPFVTVELKKMAEVFHTTVPELETELATMIKRKDIEARIDKTRGALAATHSDPKEQAALRAVELATEFVQDAEMAIRTMSMLRNNVHVALPPMAVGHGHAGAAAMAARAGAPPGLAYMP